MKAKILALLAALALTASMFAACGGDASSSAVDSGTDSSAVDSSGDSGEIPKDEAQLVWYLPYEVPSDSAGVYKKANEITKEKFNTTVDFRFANSEKAQLITSTSEYYDMIFTCSWANNYAVAARRGSFADLTDIIPKVAPDLQAHISENCWDSYTVDGKIYAIPSYKDVAASFLYSLSETVAKDADLQAEWDALGPNIRTAKPLIEKLQKWIDTNGPTVTGATNAIMCGTGGFVSDNSFDPVYYYGGGGFGYPHDATDGKIMHKWQLPNVVDAMKFAKELWDGGFINKDAATNESVPAGAFGTLQAWPSYQYNEATYGKMMTKVKVEPIYTTNYAQSAAQGIFVNSKYVERSVQYLQFLNMDKDYRNLIAFGLEGEHYNKLPEGNIEKTEKGMTGYNPWSWASGSFFTLYDLAPEAAGNWDKMKLDMDKAPAATYNGFIWDPSKCETEIAALDAIWTKYATPLQLGNVKDVDAELDKMYKEMYDAGLQKVLDDINGAAAKFLEDNK